MFLIFAHVIKYIFIMLGKIAKNLFYLFIIIILLFFIFSIIYMLFTVIFCNY